MSASKNDNMMQSSQVSSNFGQIDSSAKQQNTYNQLLTPQASSSGSSNQFLSKPITGKSNFNASSFFKSSVNTINKASQLGFGRTNMPAFTMSAQAPRVSRDVSMMAVSENHMDSEMSKTFTPRVAKSLIQEMSDAEKEEFNKLPFIELDDMEQVNFLQTISEGWAFPLKRFMNEQELLESMNMNTVTDEDGKKHICSVPITQYISAEQKETLEGESRIAIRCKAISDDVLAVIEEPEFFDNRKEEITTKTFGTRSVKHPKIDRIEKQGDFLISGKKMRFCQRIKYGDGMDNYRLLPSEIKKIAEERGADAVYAF